ncbi:hypothetical protein G7046_g7161 [Stylonectria norvegica]|nr:hypothetical protein G7046_g7161 [Stylonectria norvegica]
MCNYIYKELSCQHHYHLVESWCPKYIETERRCPPTIVSKQYWGDDICALQVQTWPDKVSSVTPCCVIYFPPWAESGKGQLGNMKRKKEVGSAKQRRTLSELASEKRGRKTRDKTKGATNSEAKETNGARHKNRRRRAGQVPALRDWAPQRNPAGARIRGRGG